MKKKEILKRFPAPEIKGECWNCAYIEICEMILPGFTRPRKCGGPFYED